MEACQAFRNKLLVPRLKKTYRHIITVNISNFRCNSKSTSCQDACGQVDLEDNMITDKIDSIEGILIKLGIIINKDVDEDDDDHGQN